MVQQAGLGPSRGRPARTSTKLIEHAEVELGESLVSNRLGDRQD
jgi:hypothetical protein